MAITLDERLERLAAQIDAWMQPYVEASAEPLTPFYRMMAYHLGWVTAEGHRPAASGATGKRLRPALAVMTCEALGGSAEAARGPAVAVELVHNFSLVHDDIQDGSDQRRGRDTVWRLWGAAQGINVGDAMFALAQVALVEHMAASSRLATAVRRLNQTCLRLVEGQFLDLELEAVTGVSLDLYEQMVARKTAALIECACFLGALAAAAGDQVAAACGEFGHKLGLAFQFQDDLLGVWGDPAVTGKPSQDDIRSRKKSLPIVLALSVAAGRDHDRLRALLSSPPPLPDGDVAAVLEILDRLRVRQLAETMVDRAFDEVARTIDAALGPCRGEELIALCRRLRARVA